MKHTVRIIGLLVSEVLATSCNKATDEDSKAQSDQPGSAATQREKAITATKETAQSVRVYAYAERDEFVDATNRELSDIQAEMERLRRVIDRSSGAARADAEARLEVASERWAAAKARLELRPTDPAQLDDLREHVRWHQLMAAFWQTPPAKHR